VASACSPLRDRALTENASEDELRASDQGIVPSAAMKTSRVSGEWATVPARHSSNVPAAFARRGGPNREGPGLAELCRSDLAGSSAEASCAKAQNPRSTLEIAGRGGVAMETTKRGPRRHPERARKCAATRSASRRTRAVGGGGAEARPTRGRTRRRERTYVEPDGG